LECKNGELKFISNETLNNKEELFKRV